MNKLGILVVAGAMLLSVGAGFGNAGDNSSGADGRALFETYCASCHRGGGNMINPKKTLKASDLSANGIDDAKDVVKLIRKPGPGMVKYDEKALSNKDAKAIAEYVMGTLSRSAR